MGDARRQWIAAGALFAAVVLVVLVLAPPAHQVAMDRRLSTYRTTPDGAGALYEALEALGVPVDRRLTPLAGVDPIRGPLAILEPAEPLSPAELDSLFAWVERGGRLILAPPSAFANPGVEDRLGLARTFHDETVPVVEGTHPWTDGIDSIGNASYAFSVANSFGAGIEKLVVDSLTGHTIVGILERGDGRILAIADGRLLSNDRVADARLAPLIARAAADWTAPGRPLRFDEYHHGHRGGSPYRALAAVLGRGDAGRMVLQLIAVALLALVPVALRFGAPRETRPPSRRSPLEHVEALGEVYRRADADGLARRRLVIGFARRIGRARPLPGEEAVFVERLERSALTGGDAAAAVAAALREDAPLPELAARIDHAVQQLNRAP